MLRITQRGFTTPFGAALIGMFGVAANGAELRFEHVMNIGSKGDGKGQFKYVEDFDITKDGRHILATDAAHAWVQVCRRD